MLSFEYEEDGVHDPSNTMDVDPDDLDDAQGDIDIDAEGVVDYEQDGPQQYSSPYEAQVASTSRRAVSADLISPRHPLIYGHLTRPAPQTKIRFVIDAFQLKNVLMFTRDMRTILMRQRKRMTTKMTLPMPTKNMAPRRNPPGRRNNPPNLKVLPVTVSFYQTRLTGLKFSHCTPISPNHRIRLRLGLWLSIQEEEESSHR